MLVVPTASLLHTCIADADSRCTGASSKDVGIQGSKERGAQQGKGAQVSAQGKGYEERGAQQGKGCACVGQ